MDAEISQSKRRKRAEYWDSQWDPPSGSGREKPPKSWDEFDPVAEAASAESRERRLEIITAAKLVERVERAPPPRFLLRPIWPEDAYGMLAAEYKAGKTWAVLDMAVSVASGTHWLGQFPVERQGPVLLFLGEGGERKMYRRLDAICRSRGLILADLPVHLCFRAPHLALTSDLAEMREAVAKYQPVLGVIDPLYLAARSASSSLLIEMGALLEDAQHIFQEVGSALVVTHHWKKGEGKGSQKMSGVGPAEWGRVLINIGVKGKKLTDPDTKASTVVLELTFEGDEIPDTTLRVRRLVWSDDPDDLGSPMHYAITSVDDDEETTGPASGSNDSRSTVLSVFKAGEELKVTEVIGRLEGRGSRLSRRFVQDSVKVLHENGSLERSGHQNTGYRYRLADDGHRLRFDDEADE